MIALPREAELQRVPPGDRIARLEHYARTYRGVLADRTISAERRLRHEKGLRDLRALAAKVGCRVVTLDLEFVMPDAPEAAVTATRVLENVAIKMHTERGIAEEDVALALISAGLSRLSAVWPPERVVRQLAGITGALIETHGIDPDTGKAEKPATRN